MTSINLSRLSWTLKPVLVLSFSIQEKCSGEEEAAVRLAFRKEVTESGILAAAASL